VLYFYFLHSQFNLFKRYFFEGTYIDMVYDEEQVYLRQGIQMYLVDYVNRIYTTSNFYHRNYYDKNELNSSLAAFLNNLGNMMFLDLEMTMPSVNNHKSHYIAEVIQVGYLLVNGKGEEISRYSQYVSPKRNPILSNRVLEFLNIDMQSFLQQAIPYKSFYEEFKEDIEQYRPAIVVYGKYDGIALNNSYMINKVPSLKSQTRFINLCQLIKTYYNLRNDPGLFKIYQIYYKNNDLQIHDALNDSFVTKMVFEAFLKDVNHETDFYDEIHKELGMK
ncbi:MAG: hypothetical protein K2I42_04720, partial [Anaeroplasmataceae bacterium]|nr:hypothetical protein [Anaeroplasmataceae bacterium]